MFQESILQYFQPSLSYHLSLRPLFCLFLSGSLRQVLLFIIIGNDIVLLFYSQLKQSEEAREAEMTDLNELTAEFTQRLTDSEKRVTAAVKVPYLCGYKTVFPKLCQMCGSVL